MKYGPVLSTVYDLIKGQGSKAGVWDDYIHTDGYAVELVAEPGRGDLSAAILEKLDEVTSRYHQVDDFELSEMTHEFPEWSDHYRAGKASPISWQDMLHAQGKGDLVPAVERDEAASQVFDDVFGPEP